MQHTMRNVKGAVSHAPFVHLPYPAQAKFNSCMDECGKEFEGKVPKLKSDIIAQMKKI